MGVRISYGNGEDPLRSVVIDKAALPPDLITRRCNGEKRFDSSTHHSANLDRWDRSLDRAPDFSGKVSSPSNTRLNSGSCPRNTSTLTFSGVGYPHERRKERKKGPAFGFNGGSR